MRNSLIASADAKARRAGSPCVARYVLVTGFIASLSLTALPPQAYAAKKVSGKQLQERLMQLELENEQLRNVIDRSRNEVPQIPQAAAEPPPIQINTETAGKALDYSKKIRELERENKDLKARLVEFEQGLRKNAIILAQNQQALAQAQQESEALKQKSAKGAESQEVIGKLAVENNGLKQKIMELEAQNGQLQASLQGAGPDRLAEFQKALGELQAENRKLAQALAEMSTQALAAEKGRTQEVLAAREGQEAKSRLSALEQQYAALRAENEALKKGRKGSDNAALAELKAQNESLRKTIEAQNEALIANDDAAKVSKRLKQENENLKQALRQAGAGEVQNGEAVQALQAEIATLRKQAGQSGANAASIEGLKQTVENLKAENERLLQAAATGKAGAASTVAGDKALLARIRDLEQRLDKERAATSEYRKMIKQYQDQGASAASAQATAEDSKSIYAPEIRALMLENQELRARLELLDGGASKPGKRAVPEDHGRQSTLEFAPVAASPVVMPELPTSSELLETEPEAKNVQLIRKNYKPLPEMPTASQLMGKDAQSVTKNLDGDALPDINEIAPAAIEPAAGASVQQPEQNIRQVQNSRPSDERKPSRSKSEEKRAIETNG